MDLIKKIDNLLETELSRQLQLIGSSEGAILFVAELIEAQYLNGEFAVGEGMRPALDIYIEKSLNSIKPGDTSFSSDLDTWKDALDFFISYYILQDYIYYSYGAKNSISWEQNNSEIELKVIDKTIFRQIMCEHQVFILNSQKSNRTISHDKILEILQQKERWKVEDPEHETALSEITIETDWKLSFYYSYIPSTSDIFIGNYKYCDFYEVYRHLLFFSLYERKFAEANKLSGVVSLTEKEITDALSEASGVEKNTCATILRDIASSSRGTFIHIKKSEKYLLLPYSFSLKDGISAILKQYANRDSDGYSANCASIVGAALVKDVALLFSEFKNFSVRTEVDLHNFDPSLPDVDVMAISYEPSLGFHIFACEVKNNLPATWAKEYLKSQGKKGAITKALSQVDSLRAFFKTEHGIGFLFDVVQKDFASLNIKQLFPTGICITVDFVIVTSQSGGMFFPERQTTVIDESMFRHIVANSDGDVNFILGNLWNLDKTLDKCYETKPSHINICDTRITYDSCIFTGLLQIDKNEYLSIGKLESIEAESIELGYRFIDHIELPDEIRKSDFPILMAYR